MAPWKSGLFPFFVFANSVNWDTGVMIKSESHEPRPSIDYCTWAIMSERGPATYRRGSHRRYPARCASTAKSDDVSILCQSFKTTGKRGSHTRPPSSSSHIFIFTIFLASESASFSVSPGATAAKTNMPLPMDDTTCLSTVTEADRTRCRIAGGREKSRMNNRKTC